MKLRIVLLYLWMVNIVDEGASQQIDENAKRKPVNITKATELKGVISPVNVKSSDVPKFNEHDRQFTTRYKMTCGSSVTAIAGVKGNARCMPNENDIVEIVKDDAITAEYCLRVLICKPGADNALCDTNTIRMWLPLANKELTSTAVQDASAQFKVTAGEIVVSLDPGCRLVFSQEQHLRHRFQNKPENIRKTLEKYPGFYLQPTFYLPRRRYQGGNQLSFGGNLHKGLPIPPLKTIECNAGCDLGQLLYYRMPPNFLIFSLIFVDGAKCEWMKICLQGSQGVAGNNFFCNDGDLLNVYIRYGFVVMPGAQNGATIRLVKSTDGTSGSGYNTRPTQIGFDFDGERFSIWSIGRERVTSSMNVNHDGHIILYFSHHDCLIKKKGIMNLGENNGKVYQVDRSKSIDSVSTNKLEFFKYSTVKARNTLGTIPTEKPTPNVSAVAPITTTPKRDVAFIIGSSVGEDYLKPRTGWLIWMIFFGFFTGSLIALLIAGLILYLARRTVYTDWYRGMYKRYGCDASGITGGVTGGAFDNTAAGGGTTMGGTTVTSTMGGTTGGGTTTSGATGTSTMGTTGGGTSTSGTSGGDMVTM